MGCNDAGTNFVPFNTTNELIKAIKQSWSKETSQSYDGQWSEDNPAKGQCCVSSLVLLDYLGGKLARGKVVDYGAHIVHYWAVTPLGELDITRDQFQNPQFLWYEVNPHKDLYLFRDTIEKYELLKSRVEKILGESHALV